MLHVHVYTDFGVVSLRGQICTARMLKVNCHILLGCLHHSLEGVPTILDSFSSQHKNLSEIV